MSKISHKTRDAETMVYKFSDNVRKTFLHTNTVTSFLLIGGDGDNMTVDPEVTTKPTDQSSNQPYLTHEQIDDIYKNIVTESINLSGMSSENNLVVQTYGEITFKSVEDIIKKISIDSDDVFYDLGSGNGKVVLQIFSNTKAKKSYGIEYFPERSYTSEHALKKLYILYPELLKSSRLISFQIQNIKDIHYLNDATIIFMCSTCYPKELLEIVYNKIKDSKRIKYIITHSENDIFKTILPNSEKINVSCSWNSNLMWSLYSK